MTLPRTPDSACRARYRALARSCRMGMDEAAVARSAEHLSHPNGAVRELAERAYRPTGIALGCPLPEPRIARFLKRVARLAERRLTQLAPQAGAVFAHVPEDWFHITLVNRTHFDERDKVVPMTSEEAAAARQTVERWSRGPLVIHLHGLILSRFGRLFVPGYPATDDLYELRVRLTEAVPVLATNLPVIAHLKLGHVLTPLAGEALTDFLGGLAVLGGRTSARLVFRDAYTPWGRIEL